MVLQGHYWTWKRSPCFCVWNLIYVPAAFLIHPSTPEVLHGLVPDFAGGFTPTDSSSCDGHIGTTIAPWMVFFQQSTVVDKGMHEKDIPWGRLDTAVGLS